MKRLTKKIGKHSSFYDCDIICNQCFNGCKVTQKVFDRLAAIEDILGYEYKLDRLRELINADKDGRCLILPCKIGATVYLITTQSDDFCGDRQVIVQAPFRLSLLDDIGKRVFLTHEEAESALKARE